MKKWHWLRSTIAAFLQKGKGGLCMEYELSAEEIQHIERYRDLLPEFQSALDKQMQSLFELQTQIMKETFESMQ